MFLKDLQRDSVANVIGKFIPRFKIFMEYFGIFMLALMRIHELVGTAKNKRTLWRSMFWTLLVTRVVRARYYETIYLIGTHCVRTYCVYS